MVVENYSLPSIQIPFRQYLSSDLETYQRWAFPYNTPQNPVTLKIFYRGKTPTAERLESP